MLADIPDCEIAERADIHGSPVEKWRLDDGRSLASARSSSY